MPVVVDASAMAAVIFREEGHEDVVSRLRGASLAAPELLKSELTQVALTKARRYPRLAAEIFSRLEVFLDPRRGIRWHDVPPVDVALLAQVTGLSAYDATYMWLAGWLEADLVTLDRRLSGATGFPAESPE